MPLMEKALVKTAEAMEVLPEKLVRAPARILTSRGKAPRGLRVVLRQGWDWGNGISDGQSSWMSRGPAASRPLDVKERKEVENNGSEDSAFNDTIAAKDCPIRRCRVGAHAHGR